jgi:hypothetical protein
MSASVSAPTDQLNGHVAEVEHWRTAAETARVAAARAEGECTALRAQAVASERLVADLRAELALARRSWLERVLEAVRRR